MYAEEFLDFIKKATCSYTTVLAVLEELCGNGYEELDWGKPWKLEKGKKYVVKIFDTSLIAFNIGKQMDADGTLMVAAAHTDQPSFVIKPNPEMTMGNYAKLNVEAYGGAILNTWLDRPLGIAGCVMTQSKDAMKPVSHIFDSKKPLLLIPNLAIHFNRDVNKGVELNKQKDLIPLAGMISDKLSKDDFLTDYLAKELHVAKDDILDYQLYLYNEQDGCKVGLQEEILLAPRIDNLASVFACMKGMCGEVAENQLSVMAVFDHEEVGSRTKQGAASDVLYRVLSKVCSQLGMDVDITVSNGLFLSLDGAHAIHPNQNDKYDPTNPIYLNDGVVIKKAANQSYSTDTYSAAVVKQMCRNHNISYKEFVNKSDSPGGSTLGSIASTRLPMHMVDAGVPMLAMHSAMEATGVQDVDMLVQLAKVFLQNQKI